jgi:2-polyprenyl-3-methyl-5-hydroxy-6-metoxy-1,4-benzoquinol methylase
MKKDNLKNYGKLSSKIKTVQPKVIRLSKDELTSISDETYATTQNVKQMYEKYPYPSPIVGDSLIYDVANVVELIFPQQELSGWNVLDAGCGTGHRMLGLAKNYPQANFTGIDITENSLKIGQKIARSLNITNVKFSQKNLLEINDRKCYNLIISTGVIHHLINPTLGLKKICDCLTDDGIILIWLYHSLGEFERLLNRELMFLLLPDKSNFEEGLSMLEELSIQLSAQRYGTRTSNVTSSQEIVQQSLDVDAFLHPIVNAYRFQEALDIFRDIEGIDWIAINGINLEGESQLIDVQQVETELDFHLVESDFIKSEKILNLYKKCNTLDKLKIVELILKPTGFSIIAGKNNSLSQCSKRIQGNLIYTANG